MQFWLPVSESDPPSQYLPPFLGFGAVHSLRRNRRQSGVHEVHPDHPDQPPSTAGHTDTHGFLSAAGPSQPGPPSVGGGSSQRRERRRVPRPHSALHSDQAPHSPH